MGRKQQQKQHNRGYKPPAGANVTNFTPQMIASMQAHLAPQADQSTAWAPGAPIQPTPGLVTSQGPRNWQYPVGYNIGQYPRATESTTFDTLRNLSSLYDAILLCQQVWFDYTAKLDLEVVPTPEALLTADGDETVFMADAAKYKSLFEVPDPDNGLDLHSWLRMALREQLELDALSVFVRKNRAGGIYALEIVDGATIKPLIDERGRRPLPPWPAFQQYWQGIPLDWYTADQIIYHRETPRADSMYGLSRTERIIMRVNQALRKQNKDMGRFTDGNLPAGILEMPPSETNEWTPDELLVYQQVWDGLLAGNDTYRPRVKVVEPGAKFTPIDDPDIMTPFDTFLLNTTVACYGLTMAELGFTENVNKSSGDSQENVTYRRAMAPLMSQYAKLFTSILRKYYHETRFIVRWRGYEEAEDLASLANAYTTCVKYGILSPTLAAKLLKFPTEEGEKPIPRYFAAATGPVFFDDLLDPEVRNAQKQAQLTGLKLTEKPGNGPQQDNADSSESGGDEESEATARAITADLRRWRDVALKDVKGGKAVRDFQSDIIPTALHRMIAAELYSARTVEQVKTVFHAVRGAGQVAEVA